MFRARELKKRRYAHAREIDRCIFPYVSFSIIISFFPFLLFLPSQTWGNVSPYSGLDDSLRRGETSRKFREDRRIPSGSIDTHEYFHTTRRILSCLSIVPGIDEHHDVVHGVTRTRVSILQPRLNAPLQGRVPVDGDRLRFDSELRYFSSFFAHSTSALQHTIFFRIRLLKSPPFLSFCASRFLSRNRNFPIFGKWINELSLTWIVYPLTSETANS